MKTLSITTLAACLPALVPGVASAVEPLPRLVAAADHVVLAEVASLTAVEDGGVRFSLTPVASLSGDGPLDQISATLAPASNMGLIGSRPSPPPAVDFSLGLWFLRDGGRGLEVLPLQAKEYMEFEAYLPVPAWWRPRAGVGLERQVLSAMAAAHELAETRFGFYSSLLTMSLGAAEPGAAAEVVEAMLQSSSAAERALGVVGGLHIGDDRAAELLSADLNQLEMETTSFRAVIFALHNVYVPSTRRALAALDALAGLRGDVAGLDVAICAALHRSLTKDTLPTLARLLDSKDPEAQRGAAHAFHTYAALAGPDGSINRSGDGRHPFFTDDTRRYAGRAEIPVAEQVAFWREWYGRNRERLGL